MKKLLLILSLAVSLAFSQTARFPGAIAADADLTNLADRAQTTLSAPLNSTATSFTVTTGSKFSANMILTIDNEQIMVSSVVGNTVNVASGGRGFAGTAAASHNSGALVSDYFTAYQFKGLRNEIEAIESTLGANLANVSAGPALQASKYDFTALTPGGSLIVGANTITLPQIPPGVNGSDAHHWLYISGGMGTPEPVPIIGGTGVAGGAGTLIVTCAYTHSGAWTIASVLGGLPEAIQLAGGPVKITVPAGHIAVHGPVYVPAGGYVIEGQGQTATTLQVDATYPISNGAILGAPFVLQAGVNRAEFSEFQVNYAQPDSPTYSDYIQYQPTFYAQGSNYNRLHHVNTNFAWSSGDFRANGSGLWWSDSYISGYGIGLQLDAGPDGGDLFVLTNLAAFAGYASTANQSTVYTSNATAFKVVHAFLMANSAGGLAKDNFVIDGGGGGAIQQFINCGFDTANGIKATNYADIRISNSYFTLGLLSTHWLDLTDSDVQIANSYFLPNGSGTVPLITELRGNLVILGSIFNMGGSDVPMVSVSGTGGSGNFTFSDNVIGTPNATYTKPILTVATGITAHIHDNTLPALFSPNTGTFLSFTGSVYNADIHNNTLQTGNAPWAIAGVSNLISGQIHDNPGYNPVGAAAVTLTGSPMTITAGATPMNLYITGTGVTGVTRDGVAASTSSVYVPAFGSAVVTYTGTPVIVQDVQ